MTNGAETSMARTWYGPFRGDPYFVCLGCTSTAHSACDGTKGLEHGYVTVYSRNRRQDPIALHRTYKWLASMCIDPAWLQHFNAHSEWPAAGERTRTIVRLLQPVAEWKSMSGRAC